MLHKLGALEVVKDDQTKSPLKPSSSTCYTVTFLGKTMASFPLAPRYAKMLALGSQHGCLPYVIALVSALSVREVFASSGGNDDEGARRADRLVRLHRSWVGKVSSVCGKWQYCSDVT